MQRQDVVLAHPKLGEAGVEREDPPRMLHDDHLPEPFERRREEDLAGVDRADLAARGGLEVEAVVRHAGAVSGIDPRPELRRDAPLDRPVEQPAEVPDRAARRAPGSLRP